MPRRDGQFRRDVTGGQRDVRQAILEATAKLLADRRFDQVVVTDVLDAAKVSRASFYFYFESKHAVLRELVQAAMAEAHEAAQPWLQSEDESPRQALRRGTEDGVRVWRKHAGVLRAIVESWRSDPQLTDLWGQLMNGFVEAATARIEEHRRSGLATASELDAQALASALCWLDERVFYLAVVGIPPFDVDKTVVDVLTDVWTAAIYGPVSA